MMSEKKHLIASQCRGARAVLGWSRDDLAKACGVSVATLADFESGKRTPYGRTLADIERALEAAGVQLIPENGGGAGVRLAKPSDPKGPGRDSK